MEDIILDPIVTRRESPLVFINKTIAGNDSLKIYPGSNLGVPNMWTIHGMLALLNTDATVANRTAYIPNLYKQGVVQNTMKGGVVAASTVAYYSAHQETDFATMGRFGSAYARLTNWSFLFGGDDEYLYFYTSNGVAGDTLEIRLELRWRNWDLGMMLPRIQKDSK